jgi:DHA2 family multidrug resistance protein-like MFS transporter
VTTMTAPAQATRREWAGLAVLALPTLLVSVDTFVLLLALPQISEHLHPSSTQLLWISDIYSFLLAGFLVTMGTLGDRIGRRRLLLIGAAAFGLASVLAAYAPNPALLIAARALLGLAGATLSPSTLALIANMFRDPRQRAVAIGVWMACFMSGAAIGPIVGGVLLERFWWGSVFLLAVPVMALLLTAGPLLLPEYRAGGAGGVDLVSVALSLAGILPVVYGITGLARAGWQAGYVAAVAAGAALLVAFVRRQRRLPEPLLDLRLLANRTFTAAMSGLTLSTMLTGAMMLFITQYFQLVAGLSPVRAGLCMVPAAVAMTASSLASPRLARLTRPAYVIATGLVVAIAGLVTIGQANGSALVIAGWALITLGSGPMVTLSVDLVMGTAPAEKAGSAAALNETSGQLGFALGVAALGSVGIAVYRARLSAAMPGRVPAGADTLGGATAVARNLPREAAAVLLHAARSAFTAGMHTTATISAVLLAGVIVMVIALLRHVRPYGPADDSAGSAALEPSHPAAGELSSASPRSVA